jgi:nucleoid DNA-binding protein
MEHVNKKELARRLSLHAGMSETDARAVIGFVVDEIKAAVISGEPVGLAGFGVFEPRRRRSRKGRNPRTGEPKEIEARTLPVFRVAKPFRDAVASAAEDRRGV